MVLIRLYSDNFEGEILTVDAYEEVVLGMSTGDGATHRVEALVMPEDSVEWENVWALDPKSKKLIPPLEVEAGTEAPTVWNPFRVGGGS